MGSHLLSKLAPPVIYGHRGASKYAPENTLAAIKLAMQQGAQGVELDVMLSKDGEVMVIHDYTVDRTTNGKGFVAKQDCDQLKKLDASNNFQKFNGEKIPTLSDVFRLTQGKCLINIELKNLLSVKDDLTEKVVDLVIKFQMEESVIFSSFQSSNIKKVRRMLPHVPAGLLVSDGLIGWLERSSLLRWISPAYIHPHYLQIDKEFVQREHHHHRGVNVWTVDEEADIQKMIDYQVDGIITNDPTLALKVRGK